MSSTNSNPSTAEEIRIGITGALLMMPPESAARREEIERLHHLEGEQKEAVAEVKNESGYSEHKKRLGKVFGMAKETLAIMKILDGIKKHGDRAAVLTQVNVLSEDCGYTDKDLVTLAEEAKAQAGQQREDQGSVFDNTPTGSRQGGKDAQPQHVAEKPVEAAPAPTPGLPPEEIVRRFEETKAAYEAKGGKGRRPKALIEATEAYEALQAARNAGEQPRAAEPGEVSAGMKAAAAEGDAFLKAEADKRKPANDTKAAQKSAADLDDELPPPAPRRGSPIAGANGQGSYRLNS